ncbi:MAG: transposase [Chloroflexota bacterium]|nr:transposase [Chloroflexota bacterium]
MIKSALPPVEARQKQQCGVPGDLAFKTKPQLGLKMIKQVHEAGTLRFRWLTCDEAFGRDSKFLDRVGESVYYFAEVPHDTREWQVRPETTVPKWKGKGRKPTRERVQEGEPDAQTVVDIANALPTTAWSRHTVKEGSKGPIEAVISPVCASWLFATACPALISGWFSAARSIPAS